MKFACPKCSTRYNVSDDKLPVDKPVRFTCKQCNNMIRLRKKSSRSTSEQPAPRPEAAASQPTPFQETTRVASMDELKKMRDASSLGTSDFDPAGGAEATRVASLKEISKLKDKAIPTDASEWFVLVGGKQIGPLTGAEVRVRFEKKNIDRRTYVWREGLGDWKRAGDVNELQPFLTQGDSAPSAPVPIGNNNETVAVRADALQAELNKLRGDPSVAGNDNKTVAVGAEAIQNEIEKLRAAEAQNQNETVAMNASAIHQELEKLRAQSRQDAPSDRTPGFDAKPTRVAGEAKSPFETQEVSGEHFQANTSEGDAFFLDDGEFSKVQTGTDGEYGTFAMPGTFSPEPTPTAQVNRPQADGYVPGEATKLFMQQAGFERRQRNLMIATVAGSVITLTLVAVIALDILGVLTIPGMGLFYSSTGLQDPNKARAVERAEKILARPDLTPERRAEIEAIRRALTGGAKGSPTKKSPEKAAKPQGKADDSEPSMAADVFADSRKSGEVKIADPGEIQAPDLPDGLTAKVIYEVIEDNNRAMKLCVAEAARKGETLSGRMEVSLTISPSGAVTESSIVTPKFRTSAMGACTLKRVKGWRFPKHDGEPVTVVFPYILQAAF